MKEIWIPINQPTLELLLIQPEARTHHWPTGIIEVNGYLIAKDEDEADCYHIYLNKPHNNPDPEKIPALYDNVSFTFLVGFFAGINTKG